MTGPRWIKQWINNLAALNELFRDDDGKVDFEALGREEYQFRQALVTHKFAKSERAKEAYQQAMTAYSANVENGKKGGRPKKSPQDAPNGNAGVDMYDAGNGAASKSTTSCDTFTADGDIREDSQDRKSGTSANLYGDAATREGAEVFNSRESGAAVPTTVSRNMRRVPQSGKDSAKTRDTRDDSRGRYAPPSCSPEDGNPAETASSHGGSVASLEARQGQALESQRRTGGHSLRVGNVARPPVRSRASFRNKEDFIQWAIDDGLDPVDAGECWEATEERGGKDADGNTVKNMKAFARQWCRTRANNRRTA